MPADAVAINAIGGGSLVVTAGTAQDVTSRGGAMKVHRRGIATNPTRGVRIAAVEAVGAHATLGMARVTARGGVAGETIGGIHSSLQGMAGDEVCRVHHLAHDVVDASQVAHHAECLGVAVVARLLLVTGLAAFTLSTALEGVVPQPSMVMGHERLRPELLHV